jgi:hypothetical protein
MQEVQRFGAGKQTISCSGSCDGAAVCDTAAAGTLGKAAAPNTKQYAAGNSSGSSVQYSTPAVSAVSLTAPPAAASLAGSVGFMPELTAQLGRWTSAWLSNNSPASKAQCTGSV